MYLYDITMLDVTCLLVVANGSFKHFKNCKSLLYFFYIILPCSINYNTLYTDKKHSNVIRIISPIIQKINSSLFNDTYKKNIY